MRFTTSGMGLKPLCSLAKCSSTADDWLDTRWDIYLVYWRSRRFWTWMFAAFPVFGKVGMPLLVCVCVCTSEFCFKTSSTWASTTLAMEQRCDRILWVGLGDGQGGLYLPTRGILSLP